MNEYYQPYYDFDQEPIQQGWIPDQNINTNQIYESPYDLEYENQVNADIQNQFQDYMQQRAMQEQQLQKRHENQYYQIKKGDTLSQIARANGITVEQLAKLNGIKDINMIKSGQLLRFDNNVNNRYKQTFRKRNVQSNPTQIRSNPTQIRKYTKANTKGNGTMLPEVTVTVKRPVTQKAKSENNVYKNTTRLSQQDVKKLVQRHFETNQVRDDSSRKRNYKKPKPTTKAGTKIYNFLKAFTNHYK